MNLQQLIYEAKKGSKAAEEALFYGLSDWGLALCTRYVKNGADAEERMISGFFSFFKSLPHFKYESDAGVYACLNKIMVNECIMQLRKKRVFDIVAAPSEEDAVLDEDPLDKLTIDQIHAMICRLPAGARTVFNLYAVEGWQHHEIARLLGITAGASRAQFTRARKMLQQSLSFLKKDDEKQYSK